MEGLVSAVSQAVAAQPSPAVLAVQEAIEALLVTPVAGRPADVSKVLVLAERLSGRSLRDLAAMAATGAHRDEEAAHPALSAATWLRREQNLGDDSARATVRLAERLRDDLPDVLTAVEQGRVTVEHAKAVAAGVAGLDESLVRQAQPELVALAKAAEPAVVRRQLRERAHAIDPALGRDGVRRQQARQGFYADRLDGLGVVLSGSLAGDDAETLLLGLDVCCEADRTAGDTRALAARRAAVLVHWARQALSSLSAGDSLASDAHTVRTHLLITCTPQQLRAAGEQRAGDQLALLTGQQPVVAPPTLPGGTPLLPEALRRLACDATMSLVLRTGSQLDVGRAARTVSGRQFAAMVVRDGGCVVRGCSKRPAQCAAHHVRHWADGGPTDLHNLVLLCHRHHHDHHDREHDLQHHDGRWITATGWDSDPPS